MTTDMYPTRVSNERIIERPDPVIHGTGSGAHALSPKEAESFESNGFIVFPEFFSDDEVAEFKGAFETLKNDAALGTKEEFVREPESDELRSIFSQHLFHSRFKALSRDRRILDKVEQILGSGVYIHHSRINIKPAYRGKSFPWHSDFETWHAEDGIPACRMVTAWVMLTDNTPFNGPLFIIPGSQKQYVCCAGETPEKHYLQSLRKQQYGVPSLDAVEALSRESELVAALGKAGTLVLHDGNVMHGSPDNISPDPRTNAFFVYNSVDNAPVRPFAASEPRAPFLSLDDRTPL